MFPIKSDLGNARIDVGRNDDMYEVIEAAKDLQRWNEGRQPSGLYDVGGRIRGLPQQNIQPEGLKFGGMFDSENNPGADILARAKQSGQNSGMIEPNQMIERPISADEAHYGRYLDRKNKETIANTNANLSKTRLDIAQQNADAKGWRTVTITDPNDPSKQINARMNDITGEVKRIDLPNNGVITRTGSPGEIKKMEDEKTAKIQQRESVKSKAQEALNVLNQLADEKTGKLKPNTEWVTGLSANFGTKYTSKGASAVADIDRLRNMLTLDLIGEMKAQSKTGATGFGQMNIKELGVLENAASKLEARNMDESEYAAELSRIREKLNKILQDETNDTTNQDFEILIDPRGIPRQIPKNQVEEALRRGARRQ